MTPPDAPDAPRDLLGQITEALREYELENYAPVEENAADWLALLVQRLRTAEAERDRLSRTVALYRIASACCIRCGSKVAPGPTDVMVAWIDDQLATCPDAAELPDSYCLGVPVTLGDLRSLRGALGASRPGEPE